MHRLQALREPGALCRPPAQCRKHKAALKIFYSECANNTLLIATCNVAVQDALGSERRARRSFSYTRRPLSTAPVTPMADPHSHANPLYGQEGERLGCCTCKRAMKPQQASMLAAAMQMSAAWGHRLPRDAREIFPHVSNESELYFLLHSSCALSHVTDLQEQTRGVLLWLLRW